jgi:hypothetical protein
VGGVVSEAITPVVVLAETMLDKGEILPASSIVLMPK